MLERIEINPRVCAGKPVIRGTRIPVSVILDQIAAGDAWEAILAGYPELKRDDIVAAVTYAKEFLDGTDLLPRSA